MTTMGRTSLIETLPMEYTRGIEPRANKGTLADLAADMRFEIELVQLVCVVKEYILYNQGRLRVGHFKAVNALRQNLDQRRFSGKQVQSSPAHSHHIALAWLVWFPGNMFQATNVRQLYDDNDIVSEE
jgi:hypothetical protein